MEVGWKPPSLPAGPGRWGKNGNKGSSWSGVKRRTAVYTLDDYKNLALGLGWPDLRYHRVGPSVASYKRINRAEEVENYT